MEIFREKKSSEKEATVQVNTRLLNKMLDEKQAKMKISLKVCARCTICAESCFLFHLHDGDPNYMPSYKIIQSIGKLYKKREKITRAELEDMGKIVWRDCVLCTRCYCPFGIDIPEMIAFVRNILRNQGISQDFTEI
jgi:heterodisulfide reductase subunit C